MTTLNIENKITALSNKQLSEQEELLLQTYLLERTTIYNTAEAIRLESCVSTSVFV